METFFHILKYKFLSFVKSTFDRRLVTAVRGFGSLAVFGGFSVAAYLLAFAVTKSVLEQTGIGLFVYHRFISMMLFVLFVSVNMGNIIVSYATLYKSAEVGYLFTKPVSFTQIFVLKFLDNFLYSSATFFLMVFMAVLGYGTYFGYSWLTFLGVVLLVMLPYLFLSACVGVLILMSLMKIAGKWGFRKVMAGLSVLYVAAVALFFKFSNPVELVQDAQRMGFTSDGMIKGLDSGLLANLPNAWVSNVLFYIARGNSALAFTHAAQLLLLTAAMFGVVLFVAHRFYYRSWLVTFEFQAQSNTVQSGRAMKLFDFRKKSALSPQIEVLLKKEYFQFFRESSQWIHLALMMVLVGVFALSVGGINLRLRVTQIQTVGYLILYAFGGFLSCSLALRFIFPAISVEGSSFWSQLSAPLNLKKPYFLKFILGFLLVLTPALFVAVFSNLPFLRMSERRPLLMYFGIYSAFWVSLTLVSLNLGLGGYFANYKEKNPIRVASSQGATLTFLMSLVYLIALVSIFIIPLFEYFELLFHFVPFDMSHIVAPATTLYMLSAALSGFALVVGLRSLQRDF
jgi:ABC-2 type transport system permease protein